MDITHSLQWTTLSYINRIQPFRSFCINGDIAKGSILGPTFLITTPSQYNQFSTWYLILITCLFTPALMASPMDSIKGQINSSSKK